jgi:hypothetical protein
MALTYVKASGIDTTGNYTMGNLTITANLTVANANITGPTTFSNISLAGNIIPTIPNTYSLGNASFYFKDAFIGPGSLYIDGQKVMQSVANTIVVSADINQTLKVATSGSGDIQIDPTGTGVIAIKGPLQIEAGGNITSSDGSSIRFTNPIATDTLSGLTNNTDLTLSALGTGRIKVDDDLVVTGNFVLQGTSGNLSVGTLTVEDNIIDISAETTGTPTANAGIRVIRGDQAATQLRWYEAGTAWQFTNDGSAYLSMVGKDSNGNISFTGSNISLGAVGNLHITGGSANYYLKTDGSGGLSWSAVTGGGGTFTANTAPPASANLPGDQWFNTSANILYEYLNDGTSNYWVDISSSSLTSAAGSGGSALVIKDEGSNLTTAATSIDFVGAGVTATNSGSDVTVTIPGGLSNARAVGYSLVFGG